MTKKWQIALIAGAAVVITAGAAFYLVGDENQDALVGGTRTPTVSKNLPATEQARAAASHGITLPVNVATQLPGPPDPSAERASVDSALRAADEAARLAESTSAPTN